MLVQLSLCWTCVRKPHSWFSHDVAQIICLLVYSRCLFPMFIPNIYSRCLFPMFIPNIYSQCLFQMYILILFPMFIPDVYSQCLFPIFIPNVYFRCFRRSYRTPSRRWTSYSRNSCTWKMLIISNSMTKWIKIALTTGKLLNLYLFVQAEIMHVELGLFLGGGDFLY